ncbi:MAG: hypothetical protein ACTS4V_00870 [Candidatus Hodgkinia cicadicola]
MASKPRCCFCFYIDRHRGEEYGFGTKEERELVRRRRKGTKVRSKMERRSEGKNQTKRKGERGTTYVDRRSRS